MIEDHTRLTEKLKEAASAAKLERPNSGMSSDQAMLLSGLQGLRGADFDKAYTRQQIVAHAQAVAVVDSFATAGADPDVKAAAKAALPIVTEHLKTAQQLQGQLGGD